VQLNTAGDAVVVVERTVRPGIVVVSAVQFVGRVPKLDSRYLVLAGLVSQVIAAFSHC
jgi:hypothetical protein